MKRIFNFIKNNILMFFAIYWLVQFAIDFIKFNPSSLDVTTRRIETLKLGIDLIWALVFLLEYWFFKAIKVIDKRIDCVNERINFLYDVLVNMSNNSKKEEKSENEDNKQI